MAKSLSVLRDEWKHCTRCGLHENRGKHSIVFGVGNAKTDVLIFYDAPTEIDVEEELPMSGTYGDHLADLLTSAGIEPKSIYVSPIVGCRPTVLLPATADTEEKIADRTPTGKEIEACHERVVSLIYAIDPRIIVASGDLAWKTLVRAKDRGTTGTLDKAIGNIFVTRIPGVYAPELVYPVIPVLGMKRLEANPSAAEHGPLRTTVSELLKGRTYVDYLKKLEERDAKKA